MKKLSLVSLILVAGSLVASETKIPVMPLLSAVKCSDDCVHDATAELFVHRTVVPPIYRLFQASREGNIGIMRQILELHPDTVQCVDEGGRTPLHTATLCGNPSVIHFLIEHGAEVNRQDDNNFTPLHYAAAICSHEVVAALLARGARTDLKNRFDRTPLALAVDYGEKHAQDDTYKLTIQALTFHGSHSDSSATVIIPRVPTPAPAPSTTAPLEAPSATASTTTEVKDNDRLAAEAAEQVAHQADIAKIRALLEQLWELGQTINQLPSYESDPFIEQYVKVYNEQLLQMVDILHHDTWVLLRKLQMYSYCKPENRAEFLEMASKVKAD